jgi:DNA processing protein
MAIPGSIHSPQSHGCHHLIRQGAKLVETANDVLEELQLSAAVDSPALSTHEDDASPLLKSMGFTSVSLDALLLRNSLDTATLQAELLGLELSGQIARLPGGLFQRLNNG